METTIRSTGDYSGAAVGMHASIPSYHHQARLESRALNSNLKPQNLIPSWTLQCSFFLGLVCFLVRTLSRTTKKYYIGGSRLTLRV